MVFSLRSVCDGHAGAERQSALIAQLDRALDYESRGRGFESSSARQPAVAGRMSQGADSIAFAETGSGPLSPGMPSRRSANRINRPGYSGISNALTVRISRA